MNRTAAVICEYNPFHKGHEYMFRVLKEQGFEHIVCFMSGNFVQRGEPACFDKYLRAKAALLCGADLVLELPVPVSCGSSRDFSEGAVGMIKKAGICDALCFGLEPDLSPEKLIDYNNRADISDEALIKEYLSEGMTYPEAVSQAAGLPVLTPNAILASGYLRAISRLQVDITPFPVERSGEGYNSEESSGDCFASARAVRKLLFEGKRNEALSHMPLECAALFNNAPLVKADDFSLLLSHRLLSENDFTVYLDVSREISERLLNRRNTLLSFTERAFDTKTRQYTLSRVMRALLHITLGIKKDDAAQLKESGFCRYLRVLAYRKDSGLLKELNANADVPVISKSARLKDVCPGDFYYDQIYYAVNNEKSEYERSPFVL